METPSIGWAVKPILQHIGQDTIPQEYVECVQTLRRNRIVQAPYVTPTSAERSLAHTHHKRGIYSKVPPEYRLVPEERDPMAFYHAACQLAFPRVRVGRVIDAHEEAAQVIVDQGEQLAACRRHWMRNYESAVKPLESLNHRLRAVLSASQKRLLPSLNAATVAATIEAAYPSGNIDPRLASSLLVGMPATGSGYDGDPCTEHTGFFRPKGDNARYTLRQLHTGKAPGRPKPPPFGHSETEDERLTRESEVTNHLPTSRWHVALPARIRGSAERALANASVTIAQIRAAFAAGGDPAVARIIDGVADEEARVRLKSLWILEMKSSAEARQPVCTMEQPMTYESFRAYVDPANRVRPARRHCIEQGLDEQGEMKHRVVDDFTRNGITDATTNTEQIDLPTFMWCIYAVAAIGRAAARRRLPMPSCTIGLDDMKAAYRMILQLLEVCAWVAYFSFTRACVVAQRSCGHYFGHKSGSPNYMRLSRHAALVCCFMFACMIWPYIDDFMHADTEAGQYTSHECLDLVLHSFGWKTEVLKRRWMSTATKALGAHVDVGRAHTHGTATASPHMHTRAKLKGLVDSARRTGRVTTSEAAAIVGQGQWLCSAVYGRCGAATLQPFVQRQHEDGITEWSEEMEHAWEMMQVLLAKHVLDAGITVPVSGTREQPTGDNLILLTDASFEWQRVGWWYMWWYVPCSIVGFLVYDQRDGREYAATETVPLSYYEYLKRNLRSYIGRTEMAEMVAPFLSLPDLFRGRRVIHFGDNMGAVSACVNGYASKPDLARMVNYYHMCKVALDMDIWTEWVPSDANIADWLTRLDKFHLLPQDITFVANVLPPIGLRGVESLWAMYESLRGTTEHNVKE